MWVHPDKVDRATYIFFIIFMLAICLVIFFQNYQFEKKEKISNYKYDTIYKDNNTIILKEKDVELTKDWDTVSNKNGIIILKSK